jgi:hypothetical protein
MYGALMSSDHEAEIRASVGAHHDLGPGYDDALAEGLVERIGAEIDKRIEAQLSQYGPPFGPAAADAGGAPASPDAAGGYVPPPGYVPAPGYVAPPGYVLVPSGYPGYPGYPGPLLPPGYQVPVPKAARAPRPAEQHSVAMTVIALGSITLGVVATAILSHAQNVGGRGAMALVIWAIIAIVNIAYARRY